MGQQPPNHQQPQQHAQSAAELLFRVLRKSATAGRLRPGNQPALLRIAKTNQKVSDIAFRAQLIATVTQICDLYWDLVNAYDNEQVGERSVAFATETLDTSRKQLELQAIPEMDVLKAEGDLATASRT
jgi:outer membrane protein TolC